MGIKDLFPNNQCLLSIIIIFNEYKHFGIHNFSTLIQNMIEKSQNILDRA